VPCLRFGMVAVVLALGVGTTLAQESVRFGVGGGLVRNDADIEGGGDIEGEGAYGIFQARFSNDLLFQISVSGSSDDSDVFDPNSGFILEEEDKLIRTEIAVGYMFLGKSVFRPFIHGGVSLASVTTEIEGVEVIDDSSTAMSAGGGFEIGSGDHHSFFLDLSFDVGHELDLQFGLGSVDFDLSELHLGYLYRF